MVEATAWLVTVNVAVVAPVTTVTDAGTLAAVVLLLESVTLRCAVVPAAGAFRVTVATEFVAPPCTVVGLSVRDRTVTGFTDRVAGADPFSVAVIVGGEVVVTT